MSARAVVCVAVSITAGVLLNRWYGVSVTEPMLGFVRERRPDVWLAIWWSWTVMLYTTPYFLLSLVMTTGWAFSLRLPRFRKTGGKLPALVPVEKRKELEVVVGELHHPTKTEPADRPEWLTIPERGLNTGIMVLGATGAAKTSACLYPFARQVLGFAAGDEKRKCSGLVLEVKGDFCHQVKEMMEQCGRADDYEALSLDGVFRYNPLANGRSPYESAAAIANILTQLYGRGKDPFWPAAYTHLMSNVIRLYRLADDYVTLKQLFLSCSSESRLFNKLDETQKAFEPRSILIGKAEYLQAPNGVIDHLAWKDDPAHPNMFTLPWSETTESLLVEKEVEFVVAEVSSPRGADARRRAELYSVTRWYLDEWKELDPKLRSNIVESIASILHLFEAEQDLAYVFCPPKEAYDLTANLSGRYGRVLPPLRELIDSGKVLALDMPMSANPAITRIIGTLLKQDWQHAMLARIPQIGKERWRTWRSVLFLCDEYHQFATCGGSEPTGDEHFFGLSRGAKCIPIVATQSLSSLKSSLNGNDSWHVLVQQFRTKLLLATSDDFTAEWASKMCGREERLKVTYSLGEGSSDAKVSLMSGKPVASRSSLSANKSYSSQKDVVFEPKVFTELKNAQCVALAYDGVTPRPARLCYLKPYYLREDVGYFEQVRKGLL